MTQTKGIFSAVAAFFSWVLVDTLVKLASLSAFPSMAILGLMGGVGIVGILAVNRRNLAILKPIHRRMHLLVGLCSLVSWYANVIAFRHLPLTVFYPLVFTAPLLIAWMSTKLGHERMTLPKIVFLVTGFLGVLVAVGPRETAGAEWIGYLACAASVGAFAGSTIIIRKISATESSASILLSCAIAPTLLGLFGLLDLSRNTTIPDLGMIWLVLLAGVLNLLANAFYNKALRHTSSTNVAQLHYTQIIWGACVGYVLWGEKLTWNLTLGAAMIIGAGLGTLLQARKEDRAASTA